ncbi:uncharacterized protein LOC110686565 [Chenopodium quinoa]|uniref:uncharacterized protein LOC110686565 n=1 Tax=Chenopodium quinoa TaxID=63459 RepID=UPI000B77115A|nr:uncharacterized protein LOC110686565 [Chenopodium quinoa]
MGRMCHLIGSSRLGPYAPWFAQWPNPPPFPYSAGTWAPKQASTPQGGPRPAGPGILGSRPQAYSVVAPSSGYTPIHIEAAMNALSYSQPDGNFYMDTSATSHMTGIKMGARILRCDSIGDLHPIFSNSKANPPINNSAFTGISTNLWHNRLGHPGDAILRSLSSKIFIDCNKGCKTFCSSCPLGKHSKLPFNDSMSHTTFPFDIIHSDLWTSHVMSSSGHCYYVLFLDD